MSDGEVRGLVEGLLGASIDTVDRAGLAEVVAANAKLKAFAAQVDVRCHRRADQLAGSGESESGVVVLVSQGNGSGRDAAAAQVRDRVCCEFPEFDAALGDGVVSGEHLDVLAQHTKHLSDVERSEVRARVDELVDAATAGTATSFDRTVKQLIADVKTATRPDSDVAELERQRASSRVKRWTDRDSGMKMTLLSLDPLRDAQLHAVFDAQLAASRQDPANAKVPFEQLRVQAVLASVSDRSGVFAVPEIVVHVDRQTVCEGRHADTMCETIDGVGVPVATVHRLCCEAVVTAVMVDADGTVRNLAELRSANRFQRRALAAMYATCAHPQCEVRFSRCRIHHVVWFSRGGRTALDNLLPLCEQHHHLVHEGGWSLTMTPDRTVTWQRPDGTIWITDHSPNRQPERHRERQQPAARGAPPKRLAAVGR